jgi:acyl-CoA dehydrogenase
MIGIDEFRLDVRQWLEANCPPEMRCPLVEAERCWGGKRWRFHSDAQRLWLERMVSKGWTVPQWSKEFGGAALSDDEVNVLRQEMRILGCRPPLDSLGIWMLGPALLKFGTDQQKRQHLLPIARGEIRWCQGYSEPEAGSDLASLKTRAEPHNDSFVVNGQKIWTSFADQADWMFCLVRTDLIAPKHEGISFLLIDMGTPGIQAKPIPLIFGASDFCETFLQNVVVPRANLVGTLNKGWEVAKYVLAHERTSIAGNKRFLGEGSPGEIAAALDVAQLSPFLRHEIAAYDVDAWALTFAAENAEALRNTGKLHSAFSSVIKYSSAELHKRKHELLMTLAGMEGLKAAVDAPHGYRGARDWLKSKANSIEGGTTEIQLNIIAKRILELPT